MDGGGEERGVDVESSFGMVGMERMGRQKMEKEGWEKGLLDIGPVWHCLDRFAFEELRLKKQQKSRSGSPCCRCDRRTGVVSRASNETGREVAGDIGAYDGCKGGGRYGT